MDKKLIFFLGGYDAEMCEIKKILDQHKHKYYDKQLQWGAKLSTYIKELSNCKNKTPVLIELDLDCDYPENTIVIDHHGKSAGHDKPTSLEQIAELLELKLDRWQQLIAANDRGWIDELLEIGATREEIEKVRRNDRQCQGVTEQEETIAEEIISKVKMNNNLIVVHSPFKHTSPFYDRLYGKAENILIFSPNSINFSGQGEIVQYLKNKFSHSYYGGRLPEKGFWGVPTTSPDLKIHFLGAINEILKR